MQRRELIGILSAVASSLLGGASVMATRVAMAETDAATLGFLRFSIGVCCLLPFALAARPRPSARDLAAIALLGVLFFAAFPWFFNCALGMTTAAHGALALSSLPLATLVVAVLAGAERATAPKLLGVALAVAGVAAALALDMARGDWRGDLVMLGAVSCGALYNVLARPLLRRYQARAFTAWAMLAGAAALGLAAGLAGSRLPVSAPAWGATLFLGICGGALAFLLWSWALERTTPTRVAISVTVNPLVPLALAPALLGEPGSPLLAFGVAAVLGGIALSSLGPEPAGKPRARSLCSRQIQYPEETSPCPTTRSVP